MTTVGYINVSLEIWGSLLTLIIAICLMIGKKSKSRQNRLFLRILICNIVILASDAAAWLSKGSPDPANYWMVRIANFLVFSFGYLLLTAFTNYLTNYIGQKTNVSYAPLRAVQVMCVVAVLFVVISQFNHLFYSFDGNNLYHRESYFWVSQIWGIVGLCINAGLLIRYRKSMERIELIAFSSYIILPVAAMCIQIFVYGIALLNLATTISILIIFLFIQEEQARRIRQREAELADAKVSIMLSQIQPHFLCNSLAAIKQLCDIEPEQAKEAVVEFSNYLRGNLDALTAKGGIPFEREMIQVKSYLSLEQKRFGDILKVVYDLRAQSFLIPPLTVQPIVENAVRHGITKKEDGGTVTISTCETQESFVITVSDDGAGFRVPDRDDGGSHLGLENVTKRVKDICGGEVVVNSLRNQGTTVTITIPKGDGECGALPRC